MSVVGVGTRRGGAIGLEPGGFVAKLNSVWHERALKLFAVVVLAHWAEHLAQAVQIFVLGWPRTGPNAGRGILGQFFPWLVTSETLHYGYALVMLIGLFLLRPGFSGRSLTWWTVALAIQFWHHIEHLALIIQASTGHFWFGSAVPTSFVQLLIPQMRIELHLFYNTIVFIPMVIAMYFHVFPTPAEAASTACDCSLLGKAA